ncbi:permease [Shumkonia mesophila]|uniref:permease n=1 Tax=Shumkonia mesophila TaxID=2838854 RepID=UPI002934219C|nr:permease [Shumkonia mesophila]
MTWKNEWKALAVGIVGFLSIFFLPIETDRVQGAILEAFHLANWYAQEHVLLCLIPAFFIAGAIGVFLSQASVMKYLGAKANKVLAYGVASVSGTLLAVCSCTVLPLFAGIYRMGAGLGPATAFLYSGPAINVLAIVLTARVLGLELGIARAVGAILFSIVIGLVMHLLFLKEEREKASVAMVMPEAEATRPLWQNALFFASMVGILVFATWGEPAEATGVWAVIWQVKWLVTAAFGLALGGTLVLWFGFAVKKVAIVAAAVALAATLAPDMPLIPFSTGVVAFSYFTSRDKGEIGTWFGVSWDFAKQILPLLFIGVLVAGALLGRPGHEGLIPSEWVSGLVGGNSLAANLFASVVGAFMYFATLTEVPILQGLIGAGMGKGPALALLLAGPALSLPSMLVIRTVLGTRKTLAFVVLVVVMATVSGMLFGTFFG